MRNAGVDLFKYVITLTDGSEVVRFAADGDTAVHLAGIEWNAVVKVEGR